MCVLNYTAERGGQAIQKGKRTNERMAGQKGEAGARRACLRPARTRAFTRSLSG